MDKQIELLMREYELYEVDCLDSYRDVLKYLRECNSEVSKNCKILEFERKRNAFFGRYAKELRRFLDYKPSRYFRTANIFIGKLIDICDGYGRYFDSLENRVNDDNYPEVYRLARFVYDKYDYDFELMRDKSDNALCRYNGICFPSRKEDVVLGDAFSSFFRKTISDISRSKAVEKVKK